MSTIRLLTFDLDDTLWNLRPVLLRAEQLTWEWLVQHAAPLVQRFTAEQLRDMRIELARREPALRHRVSELRQRGLREALQLAGYADDAAESLAQQAFEVFVHARHEVNFFEDALDVLGLLRRNYLLAAITNGNASPARLGLDHLFAFTISAELLDRPKPHADPFEAALTRANCTAREAIHIGDHVEHDVLGAMQAGMRTIWVNRPGDNWPALQQPDATIRHLAELPDAVRRIAEGNS
jgi:putative hydrolase of the HAD superfamily